MNEPTQLEKRIRLAECYGLAIRLVPPCPVPYYWTMKNGDPADSCEEGFALLNQIPDYFISFDAVHHFESELIYKKEDDKFIYPDRIRQYSDYLDGICFGRSINATAAEKCEAIGKTFKLW